MTIGKLSALIELATGIALLLVPGLVLALIFQVEPDQISAALSRLCGVALISLALASGTINLGDSPQRSSAGLIAYNLGTALLFLVLHFSGIEKGLMFWPVAAAHALIGGLMVVGPRQKAYDSAPENDNKITIGRD